MRRSVLRTATGRTRCDPLEGSGVANVIRWLIVVFLALLIFSGLRPWLEKIGLGKLPGDFRFRLFGREWFIPLTSSVALSLVAMLVAKFL
jgi:hypothetical protein